MADQRRIIVVARIEEHQQGRTFAGRPWGPQVTVREARAAVWLKAGGDFDLGAANRWADAEGWVVYTFPLAEQDPLGAAKALALSGQLQAVR